MKVKIYCAATGGNNPGNCGYAFMVIPEVNLTGETIMHYSGCTGATQQTAEAMAILQALYWARENKPDDYCIYVENPEVIIKSTIADRIAAMKPKTITSYLDGENNGFFEMTELLAQKALNKIVNEPNMTFAGAETGNQLIQKKTLWSQSYLVIMKSLASRTIMLKNLTTVSKKIEAFTQKEFDDGDFIMM